MNKSEERKADKRLFSGISNLDGKYLIGGILDFLSSKELKPLFYSVRNKHIRKSLKESVAWKRCLLSSISYLAYLDQIFIRLNEKMYWPVFQDVFANDIKNFENKLASIEISDEIRDKFAFNSDCGKIVSPAMYFWVKIMSMENIAFDILSLTQQDFDDYYLKQNDGYCSDIRERKIDLNLWEVVKDILSKSSKDRVDKIFNKFKDRQIGDYEIETFDSYAKESGKKFDECENREIVWLNLCATLKGNIENEYSDLKKKASYFASLTVSGGPNMGIYGGVYFAVKRICSLEDGRAGCNFVRDESNYKKFVEGLISKHKELQDMKNWIRNGFYTQRYKIDAAKLIEDSKTWRDIFEYAMSMYNYGVFDAFSEKMASLEQNSNNANIENDGANIYEQWRNKLESQLKSCKKYLISDHAPEFVQNDSRNSNFINNFTKINQEQPTSLYIDDIIKDMQNNERYIQNYIDGKSMEIENDQENNFDKSEFERKDEQNIEIQENINLGEINNNRPDNIEIKNEPVTNKNDRNTDENRNNDKKLDLNGSNSENTNKFKDVNENNIGNTHDPNSIGDSEKLEIRRLNDSNNRMQNDYLNNNKDQNITIDDDRNNREEHGNENRVKNSLRIKSKNSDIANENQDDTKKNESDIHNYIDRKSTEVENDQEDDSDKSEFERKDEQNIEIQENINLGEINNNRPDNIEIKNEPVTNKNDRNTDENRNNDKKLDLNGSNSQSTDKFKDVNDSNNIGNAQDLNSIEGSEKTEIKRLNDSNNGMQNDHLNNSKDQNITIDDDRNDREKHGNKNKVKNSLRNKSKDRDIANENQNDTKKNESDINSKRNSLNEIKYEQQSMSMKKDKNKNQNIEKDNSIDDNNKNENINNGQSKNGKGVELKIKDKNKSEIKYENPNNEQVTKSQRKPTALWIILAVIDSLLGVSLFFICFAFQFALYIILAIAFLTVILSAICIGLAVRYYKFNCKLEESLSQTLENNHEENAQNDRNKTDDNQKSRTDEFNKRNPNQRNNLDEELNGV